MENLKLRIKIFKDSGLIDDKIEKQILDILKHINEKYNLNINEKNSSMFVTHLVMAFKRIRDGEDLKALDKDELEELKSEENYEKALEILSNIEREILNFKIAENEIGYILVHLINLLGGIK